MSLRRFTVEEWFADPLSRRRSDPGGTPEQRATVQEICARVASEGDAALQEYGRRFDGWSPAPGESFEVPRSEVSAALERLGPDQRSALEVAASRIRAFHRSQSESARPARNDARAHRFPAAGNCSPPRWNTDTIR